MGGGGSAAVEFLYFGTTEVICDNSRDEFSSTGSIREGLFCLLH